MMFGYFPREDHGPYHPKDGWARAGCTCAICVELRTRPVGGYEIPDEEALHAGLLAIEHYVRQQETDGDYTPIEDLSIFEQRGFTLLRAKLLNKAVQDELSFQKVFGSGSEGGVL